MVYNVQALRFYAAMTVMLFHVASIYKHHKGGLLDAWASLFHPYGGIGIDVFFVISGFVIWTSTASRHEPADAVPFALRRLGRILVTYWPALAFAALVDVFIRQRDLFQSDLLRSIALLPPEFGKQGARLLLPVSWTLTFELMFYGIFALLMLLPRKIALYALVLWGVMALSPLSAFGGTFLSPFVAEFAAGCVLGFTMKWLRPERVPLTMLAALMVVFFVAGAEAHGAGGKWWRVIWWGSLGLTAVVAAVSLESRGLVAPKILVTMGGASYALYLFHFPILQGFSYFGPTVKVHPEMMMLPVIALSLVVSFLWWVLFEEEANRRIKSGVASWFDGRRRVVTPAE